jgi:type IV pilus assembly protein PilF
VNTWQRRGSRSLFSAVVYAVCAVVGLCVLNACATSEEATKKSQGYYQEGLASLNNDRQKAFVAFQKAVQADPNNKEAHYGLGHLYVLQGKLPQAEQQFRVAISIDDAYSEAHTYLGQVLASQGKWDEAIRSYRAALANPLYTTPDLARFHLGLALAHQGDLQGAMEVLEDAVTANPPHVAPALTHLELGRVYWKLGYNAKAREVLNKVVTMDKGGEYATAATELLARIK